MKYSHLTLWVACGCSSAGSDPSVQSRLSVRTQSTDGTALAGVILELDGHRVTSDADGAIALTVSGNEGERREISVVCPENYEASSPRLTISVRKPTSASKSYAYEVSCTPLRHEVVIAVRAIRGPDLPVLYLGSEIARTNEDGVAHALVTVPAGESLRITLASDEGGLLPRNPTFDFPAVERDEVLSISEVFEPIPQPKALRVRATKKADDRPRRL
jgi:hypothetical protein